MVEAVAAGRRYRVARVVENSKAVRSMYARYEGAVGEALSEASHCTPDEAGRTRVLLDFGDAPALHPVWFRLDEIEEA